MTWWFIWKEILLCFSLGLVVSALRYPFHAVRGALCNFPCHITGSCCLIDPECACIFLFYKFWRPLRPAHINIACIIEILANAFQVLCTCWIKVHLCIERMWWEESARLSARLLHLNFPCIPLLVWLGYHLDTGVLLRKKLYSIRLLVLLENRLKGYNSPWRPRN